jgi:hypothetical protein
VSAMPAAHVEDHAGPVTLARLARLDTGGHPVLTVYVDLDPSRFPTPKARRSELESLMDEAHRLGAADDFVALLAWLDADPESLRDVHGLAVFSLLPAGVLEVVRLHSPVEPLVVVDSIAWLEPLASRTSDGSWGVAVASRRAARLFRGDASRLTEFASFQDPLHRRIAAGGFSQDRIERRIENQVEVHARHVAARLFRAHQRRPFKHLVIVAADEVWPLIEHSLHDELRRVLAGTVPADLEQAGENQILTVVRPVIERTERERERDLVARLERGLAVGRRAAAGPADVRAALEQEQVETLLVSDDHRADHAIAAAERQAASVVVLRHEGEWLERHGGIAATLRW